MRVDIVGNHYGYAVTMNDKKALYLSCFVYNLQVYGNK